MPDGAALAGGDELRASLSEVRVILREGKRAVAAVAVVDAADDRVALVGNRTEVHAAGVIGVMPHGHGGGDPAGGATV